MEIGIDNQIDECRRRAFRGVSKAKFHKGKVVGFEKVYSDTLAMFLIKAHRPEYRDKMDLGLGTEGTLHLHINTDHPDRKKEEEAE